MNDPQLIPTMNDTTPTLQIVEDTEGTDAQRIGFIGRHRIAVSVRRVDRRLAGKVSLSERRRIRKDLKQQLSEAALDVGASNACKRLGSAKSVAAEYIVGDRLYPRISHGIAMVTVVVAVAQFVGFFVFSLLGSGSETAAEFGPFATTYIGAPDDSIAISSITHLVLVTLCLISFAGGARMWRLILHKAFARRIFNLMATRIAIGIYAITIVGIGVLVTYNVINSKSSTPPSGPFAITPTMTPSDPSASATSVDFESTMAKSKPYYARTNGLRIVGNTNKIQYPTPLTNHSEFGDQGENLFISTDRFPEFDSVFLKLRGRIQTTELDAGFLDEKFGYAIPVLSDVNGDRQPELSVMGSRFVDYKNTKKLRSELKGLAPMRSASTDPSSTKSYPYQREVVLATIPISNSGETDLNSASIVSISQLVKPLVPNPILLHSEDVTGDGYDDFVVGVKSTTGSRGPDEHVKPKYMVAVLRGSKSGGMTFDRRDVVEAEQLQLLTMLVGNYFNKNINSIVLGSLVAEFDRTSDEIQEHHPADAEVNIADYTAMGNSPSSYYAVQNISVDQGNAVDSRVHVTADMDGDRVDDVIATRLHRGWRGTELVSGLSGDQFYEGRIGYFESQFISDVSAVDFDNDGMDELLVNSVAIKGSLSGSDYPAWTLRNIFNRFSSDIFGDVASLTILKEESPGKWRKALVLENVYRVDGFDEPSVVPFKSLETNSIDADGDGDIDLLIHQNFGTPTTAYLANNGHGRFQINKNKKALTDPL